MRQVPSLAELSTAADIIIVDSRLGNIHSNPDGRAADRGELAIGGHWQIGEHAWETVLIMPERPPRDKARQLTLRASSNKIAGAFLCPRLARIGGRWRALKHIKYHLN